MLYFEKTKVAGFRQNINNNKKSKIFPFLLRLPVRFFCLCCKAFYFVVPLTSLNLRFNVSLQVLKNFVKPKFSGLALAKLKL